MPLHEKTRHKEFSLILPLIALGVLYFLVHKPHSRSSSALIYWRWLLFSAARSAWCVMRMCWLTAWANPMVP